MAAGGLMLRADLVQSDEGDRTVEIPADQLVGFEFEDRDTGTDIAKLTLRNDDMRWYDEASFRAGQKLDLAWGWADDPGEPRRMVVKKPSQGSNPIVVTLHDEGALLDLEPHSRLWSGRTDAQIARAILGEHGYTGLLVDVADTVAVREGVTQLGTDAAFLTTLARRNGFRWWIDAAGAHWGPRPLAAQPSAFFNYRADFGVRILAQPEIVANIAKDVARVKVAAIDPWTRKEVTATAGAGDGDDAFVAPLVSLGNDEEVSNPETAEGARAPRVSRTRSLYIGAATQDEVRAEADRVYRETALARYTMTVPVLGDRRLGAKQLHHWTLPSETMSGLWYCAKATTSMASGDYRITLHYVKDALGKLFLERLQGVARSKNTAEPQLDENGQPVDTDGMTKQPTIMEENGREVPAYHWVDSKGGTVGKALPMSTTDWAGLSDADKASLRTASAGSLVPPGR